MHELVSLHARLTARVAELKALDWPLTSHEESGVFTLCARMLDDAETYLDDGRTDAAALALRVAEGAVPVLVSLHALATGDI